MTFARLRRRKAEVPDLSALLNSADPGASRPLRHLWLIDFLDWLRRPAQTQDADSLARERGTPLAVMRLRQALGAIERNPTYAQRIGRSLVAFIDEMDWVSLLADYGFSPQPHFVGELAARVRLRMLPATPDTNELAELFNLLFRHADDEVWLMALDDECLQALSRLIAAARGERLAPDSDAYVKDSNWREPFFEALQILCSHIRASGMSQALRRRIAAESVVRAPFRQLAGAAEAVYDAARGLDEAPLIDPLVAQKALYLRSLFDACRRAADTVADHLEEHGISVNVVFQTDQLRERIRRAENLLNCVLSPEPARELTALLADLMRTQQQRRSLRALFSAHYSLLTRKVVERSADAGEHYITRSLRTYRAMLIKAAGGGAVLAPTTLFKFFILRLQASAFWLGLAAGVNYAASFVLIYLLGWTVATKQPAMTAPALAAQLNRASDEDGVEAFVDEVAHLIRSQMAGIIGNMCAVAPGVVALQSVSLWLTGRTLISEQEAHHVLDTLTVWGPTLIFAALTGVLLFLSSLIGGWVENWFVLHRLESAICWNPRIRARLGAQRAQRWARWWRAHISGLSSNVSLGLMLGVVPAIGGFFAVPLEVRHVTLSTGQVAAALVALGTDALRDPSFWWCVLALPLTGLVNVGVSFYLAFRLALRARGLRVKERTLIYATLFKRLRQAPRTFILPPHQASPSSPD